MTSIKKSCPRVPRWHPLVSWRTHPQLQLSAKKLHIYPTWRLCSGSTWLYNHLDMQMRPFHSAKLPLTNLMYQNFSDSKIKKTQKNRISGKHAIHRKFKKIHNLPSTRASKMDFSSHPYLHQVWWKSAHSFWRRRWKCTKFEHDAQQTMEGNCWHQLTWAFGSDDLIKHNKVVLKPSVLPDCPIHIFKQIKVKMTIALVMSPWSMSIHEG